MIHSRTSSLNNVKGPIRPAAKRNHITLGGTEDFLDHVLLLTVLPMPNWINTLTGPVSLTLRPTVEA